MNAIVAISKNNIIGYSNGKLIEKPSIDMKFFTHMTLNGMVIMGRKTWETFKKPLPNRTHIVISKNQELELPKGVHQYFSFQPAFANLQNSWLIGGASLYKQALEFCDGIFITRTKENALEENAIYFPFKNDEISQIFSKNIILYSSNDISIEYYFKTVKNNNLINKASQFFITYS